MALIKFTNFGTSTIANAGGILAGDLSLDVAAGEGALFPALGAGEYFYCVLVDWAGNREVIKVTARAVDTFTITRAQDGTAARAFALGDMVELRLTKGTMDDLIAYIEGIPTDTDFTKDEDNMVSDSASHLATQQSIRAFVNMQNRGEVHRPKFTWKDADEIYIGAGGVWHLYGAAETFVYTGGTLTFQFGSGGSNATSSDLNNDDWHYLYLDDSVIQAAATNLLTAAMLVNSTTEPTWSTTKLGWYNGNDRCIAAFRTGASANILEFYHEGDTIFWADDQTVFGSATIAADWSTTVTCVLPVISRRAMLSFIITYINANVNVSWRTHGQAGTTGHYACSCHASSVIGESSQAVYTDASGVIDVKESGASNDTLIVYQHGYSFDDGS